MPTARLLPLPCSIACLGRHSTAFSVKPPNDQEMGLNGQHAVVVQPSAATSSYCPFLFKTFVLVTASIILLSTLEFLPTHCGSSVARARAGPWKSPRPFLAPYKASHSSAWPQQARSNLSAYKSGLLAHVRPFYGKQQWWEIFVPIITCPPDRPLTRYGGKGDGGKLLCKLEDELKQKGCVIYSLGSNGDYGFEQAMINDTLCQVHTFDCTYNGTSQHPRHSYHKWCVGDSQNGQQYRSWRNITASLGHSRIDLLKMDIEGYEHDVLPTWTPDDVLPDELSMEFHVGTLEFGPKAVPNTTVELALVFSHLANLGFAAYAQEPNVACCREFTFMRLHD